MKLLLERFRARSAAFVRYSRPFHDSRYVYATNGVIACRIVASMVDLQGVQFCSMEIRQAMNRLFGDCSAVMQWPLLLGEDIPPVDRRICPSCDQQGLVWYCVKCGGSGTELLDNGYKIDCAECGGRGVKPGKRSLDDVCKECGGPGWIDMNASHSLIFVRGGVTVPPVAVRVDYLRKIMEESPAGSVRYRLPSSGSADVAVFAVPEREIIFAVVPTRANDRKVVTAKFVLEDIRKSRLIQNAPPVQNGKEAVKHAG